MGNAKTARSKSAKAQIRAHTRPKTAPKVARSEHKPERRIPDPAVWGALPEGGAQRFSLNLSEPGRGSRKVGIEGDNGVMRYNWPISVLSVDWVREHFGTGHFIANWLVDEGGRLRPRGRSRAVEIVGGHARGRARRMPGAHTSPAVFYRNGVDTPPAAAPAPAMPPDVADMRVRAAEDIANQRIKAQQEIFREQLTWQREQSDQRYAQLEERMSTRFDELERRRGRDDDDDDDGPSEWAWLKDLVMPLAPTIQALAPELLKRFASGGKLLP